MAAITTSDVCLAANTVLKMVKFGGAAVQGDTVYLDTTDSNRWKQADANASAAAAGGAGMGILLHKIDVADQYGLIATDGTIYLDVTGSLVTATTYIVGDNAGDIQPDADAAAGWFKTIIGVAGEVGVSGTGFDELKLDIHVSGKDI